MEGRGSEEGDGHAKIVAHPHLWGSSFSFQRGFQ